jgi:HK97 family phage prohead protease
MEIKDFGQGFLTKDYALEIKGLTEEGTFEGYASVFGNVDSYGDVVDAGAFTKSLKRRQPLLLWQHDPSTPLGIWEGMAEDTKGLRGVGKLFAGVRAADEALILLRGGAVQGLSIGYRVLKYRMEGEVRHLSELDLMEVSIVSFPANGKAKIDGVKSEGMDEFVRRLRDGEPPSIKEFEAVLRDAGFPKSMATAIASQGYAKAIRSESEGKSEAARFLSALLPTSAG